MEEECQAEQCCGPTNLVGPRSHRTWAGPSRALIIPAEIENSKQRASLGVYNKSPVRQRRGPHSDDELIISAFGGSIRSASRAFWRVGIGLASSCGTKKKPQATCATWGSRLNPGIVLLSRTVASTVPSALRGLTALFGMGRGVSPSILTPEIETQLRSPVQRTPSGKGSLRELHNLKLSQLIHYIIDAPDLICDQ